MRQARQVSKKEWGRAATENQEATPTEGVTSEEITELLDEIDAVLEENAATFVHMFIQKGGE